jgi:hypothetical protein
MFIFSVACFEFPNLLYLIVGSIVTAIMITIVILASYATVNLAPVPNDLFAVTTPVYRIALYCALIFMTVNENVISRNIYMREGWWESLFNIFVITALFGCVIYYLPFQVLQMALILASNCESNSRWCPKCLLVDRHVFVCGREYERQS